MEEKKKKTLSSLRFWALSQGMEEVTDEKYTYWTDIAFIKDNKIYGFITEFNLDTKGLKSMSKYAREFCDYIYIVTDDNAKRKYIADNTAKDAGIFCCGDIYGLGYVYLTLREAKLIK